MPTGGSGVGVKAMVQDGYGPPEDVLELREVDDPDPGPGEVLVRVRAAGLNIGDWHIVRGKPYLVRLVFGLRKPRHGTPGMDLAGVVEAVGPDVDRIKPGDEVFGWCDGAFAELACAAQGNLLPMPADLSHERAAAVGDSAFTALAAVRDQAKVEAGQSVLVNGASGGVGTFAVQIAKSFGARVTAVCSTPNVELVRSLGADRVVDYTREDFAAGADRYDVMIDLVGNRSLSECRRALDARGTYVLVGVKDPGWFGMGRQLRALALSPFVGQRMRVFVVSHDLEDLKTLKRLVEAGEIAPAIDARYDLGRVPEALRRQGEGPTRGKTVITVGAA